MSTIVILGGGFAGVAAALRLQKYAKQLDTRIVLVDKRDYHLFTPSLYEVATSEEPMQNIAIPFSELFSNKIETIKAEVTKINTETKTIDFKDGQPLTYDYMLITVGSETAYYNIPGLAENSIPLKSLEDAAMIKDKIVDMSCKGDMCNKKTQVVIGGGGFSGTEFAAELLTYKYRLSKQFKLSPDCLEVSIIQGSDHLLNELDPKVSAIAHKRLNTPSVHLCFGGHIKEVTKEQIIVDNGKTYPYDIFVWTGGVKGNSLVANSNLPVNKRGQLPVNDFLQVQGFENIFAAGDIAEYKDKKTDSFAPTVAQVAEEEGACAAENIINLIQQNPLVPYRYKHFGYVVPLHGRYAVAQLMGGMLLSGFPGWVLQQFVFLYYLLRIFSWNKAFKKWNYFELELSQ